ncbi:hypothetical protein BJ165DRAFT_995404 [Panaeolus papilionaceus]|nr:hypothetical protein BJ165DRAFT_995404 [Panaeolus papilionaceus]
MYMASCGDKSCNDIGNRAGLKWFKVGQEGRDNNGRRVQVVLMSGSTGKATVPQQFAPGNYIVRHEIIALHRSAPCHPSRQGRVLPRLCRRPCQTRRQRQPGTYNLVQGQRPWYLHSQRLQRPCCVQVPWSPDRHFRCWLWWWLPLLLSLVTTTTTTTTTTVETVNPTLALVPLPSLPLTPAALAETRSRSIMLPPLTPPSTLRRSSSSPVSTLLFFL